MGERIGVYMVFMGKPEGKRPLERPRSRWETILRWIFRKWDGVEAWTGLILVRIGWWRALVHAVRNLRIPQNSGIT